MNNHETIIDTQNPPIVTEESIDAYWERHMLAEDAWWERLEEEHEKDEHKSRCRRCGEDR